MKKLHLISNAHLDPIWQWEWEEGAAAGHGLTVALYRPDEVQIREVGEVAAVLDDHLARSGVEGLHREGLDDLLVFHETCVGASVGVN